MDFRGPIQVYRRAEIDRAHWSFVHHTGLEGERCWVRWKNERCTLFDEELWGSVVGIGEGKESDKEGRV